MNKVAKTLLWTGAALAGSTAAYRMLVRPWHRHWGATDNEVAQRMPGDDLVAEPDVETTHAITIGVDPEEVWPWLVQMGETKAGFYSYDWIEDKLGMRVSSSERIEPEHQQVTAGQALVRDETLVVDEVFFEQALVIRVADDVPDVHMSWAFALHPFGKHSTRLVVRMRYRNDAKEGLQRLMWNNFAVELGHFAMERKMLQGIKQRAEGEHKRLVDQRRQPPAARPHGSGGPARA